MGRPHSTRTRSPVRFASMATDSPRLAIVGSGFSGLCLGIRLKQLGIDCFTIFEKADRLGGTWRDNTYPGAACDVPAFSYCFSFEQKTDWSRKWAPQEEIRDYMDHWARKYDALRHTRFGSEVAGARWDDDAAAWRIRTASGAETTADVLVSAVGQLNRPAIPPIPGLERFRGERFHSARWNHAYDLAGKRVAVIGNAASAIQFIPQIAPRVAHLTIFQRSANWMLPRGDRAYRAWEKWLCGHVPGVARLYRWWIWANLEMRFPLFRGSRMLAKVVGRLAERNIQDTIADPRLREVLLPDYPIGGKRILISDDYYQALGRANVEVVTDGIDHVREDAVVGRDGRVQRPDRARARTHGLGGNGEELVQDRERPDHEQLVRHDDALLVDDAALRPRAVPAGRARGVGRALSIGRLTLPPRPAMLAEEVEHRHGPRRRPARMVLRPFGVSPGIVREVHVGVGIRAAPGVAGQHLLLRAVDDDVGERRPERQELAHQQLAVRADARDVARVVDVEDRQPPVGDLELREAARPVRHRVLRARVVESLERIGPRVHRRRGDAAAADRIEEAHRGAIRPSGEIDAARVDLARGDLRVDEVIDCRRVDVLRI